MSYESKHYLCMTGHSVFENIEVSRSEILECSFSNWCVKFSGHTSEYKIFSPLPDSFLRYLESDSIRLSSNTADITPDSDNDYSDWEQEDEINITDANSAADPAVAFAGLHHDITCAISDLGGVVTPKLNWSAPKDARWILPGNNMRCTNADDIYLLLKSSDHVVDDLEAPFAAADDVPTNNDVQEVIPELVLRRWREINPALEFRVFVRDGRILGISQRDLNHYIFLRALKTKIERAITDFVLNTFVSRFPLKCVVDLYVPAPYTTAEIIDVNPFTRKTDPLLFTWHELLTQVLVDPFRLVESVNPARFASKEYSESSVPIEALDGSLNSGEMVEMVRGWSKLHDKEVPPSVDEPMQS